MYFVNCLLRQEPARSPSFLLLQNILAARIFLETFLTNVQRTRPTLLASPNPITIPASRGTEDDVFVTSDYTVNFLQLAIRTCQRGNGETSDNQRDARNAWVRLQSRYRGKSSLLSGQAMTQARFSFLLRGLQNINQSAFL